MKKLLATLVSLIYCSLIFAQPHMSISLQNTHLWRGGEVADGFVMTSDIYYSADNDRLKFGFWGGTNTVGDYKEFNNCVSYKLDKLYLGLSDTYNFSSYATYNNDEFFNYDPSTTGRFLDATVKYSIGEQHPLVLSWSTVLFGRDRNAENTENRYSTFCSVTYPIYTIDNWCIETSVGAAFAINNIDNSANFYGKKAGVVEITLKVSNTLHINKYEIPVYMLMMWDPQTDKAYMQFCARLVSF